MVDNFSKYLVADYLDKHNYLLVTDEGFELVDQQGRGILKRKTFGELAETIFDMYHEELTGF